MATISVHSLFGDIQSAIDYIADEKKTKKGLCEGKNVNVYNAKYDWSSHDNRTTGKKVAIDYVNGYHFRQSFEPGSITPEEVYEIGKEWIEAVTGGHHNYVISVHTDKHHTHSHIIVDPINNLTKKKWRIFYKRDLIHFKDISDRICLQHGKSILKDQDAPMKNTTYYEWMMKNKRKTYKDIISDTIDSTIPLVSSYDEFKEYLTRLGFQIEDGLDEEDTTREESYSFTISQKMFVPDKERQDEYCVRLPHTSRFMYLPKNECRFTSDRSICFTSIMTENDYEIYDRKGNYTVLKGSYVKDYWEHRKEKKESLRKGLRIKIPNSSKFIRCDNIDKINHTYSLDNIINRINEESPIIADEQIQRVLNATEEEILEYREKYYADSGIRESANIYAKTKQQRFFDYKVNELQTLLDRMYMDDLKERSLVQDARNVKKLENLKKEIISNLDSISHMIEESEKEYEILQQQIMEEGRSEDRSVLNKFVSDKIAPLRQTRTELKNEAKKLSNRIQKANEYRVQHNDKTR